MKFLPLILVLSAAIPCSAQTPCFTAKLADAASRVHLIQEKLKQITVEEMDENVPAAARDQMTQLKDALSCTADAVLAEAGPSVNPVELQKRLAGSLQANPPEPGEGTAQSKDDHLFDEANGAYGHNLRVQVTRPSSAPALIQVEFSINIECGVDEMLLVYTPHNGVWRELMRWQSPPLKQISDAFGDFFLTATLSNPEVENGKPHFVVAHGTPWCTSRFSGFAMDVLSPASDPNSPKVLWHTGRSYSRGDFETKIKATGNTFELRVNDSCMDINCYERHVIYRYRIDKHEGVHRIQPIATDARGFVEEWLSAPWSESQTFSEPKASLALQKVHDEFSPEPKSDPGKDYTTHSYGPVRACKTPGMFQVQINSTLEKIVPGKPGGESQPRPTHYFHVRGVEDGYRMVSAPTEPAPSCSGPDLMPAKDK